MRKLLDYADTDPYRTQKIDLADMPTLKHEAIDQEVTEHVPVMTTPLPAMPVEVACGFAWSLYKYGTSYTLALHSINGSIEVPLEKVPSVGYGIHLKYKQLEEDGR